MQSSNSKWLVVDASVAGAAGGEGATDPVSISCTEFLETLWDERLYCVAMNPKLHEEWDEHQSGYAAEWLASMITTGRSCDVESSENQALCAKIEKTALYENQHEGIRKDFHLLEAALATDQTVVSRDRDIRDHFARATQCGVSEIQDIVWVNPERTEEEEPIVWLQNGAPPEDHRKLRKVGNLFSALGELFSLAWHSYRT